MPIFYNRFEKYIVVTNYKVMYGTLYRQKELSLISNKIAPFFMLAEKKIFDIKTIYLLVRNPYDRMVSFYMHKLYYNKLRKIDENRNKKSANLQPCQRIFLPYLNVTEDDDYHRIGSKLYELKFEQFINLVPLVYKLDGHLWPQHWAYNIRWKRFPIMKIKKCQVIQIEKDISMLEDILKINIGIRANKTKHESYDKYFEGKTYKIVNQIYQKDFMLFGYKAEINK